MRISWNWLSEWLDLSQCQQAGQNKSEKPLGDAKTALAHLLTSRGLEVESIDFLGRGLEKVITARIVSCEKHPQADRLKVCQVAISNAATGDSNAASDDLLQIVCGAPNAQAGMTVALAQVGAALPNGMKITANTIRGVMSHGMLCSEEELGLPSTLDGILSLPPTLALGLPVAEVLGRSDTLFTLKLTANRGDGLSHFGIAREVGAALHQKPKKALIPLLQVSACEVSVALDAESHVPQFFGCVIQGVKVGPSPAWLVQRLESLGSRSINNIVDATNWVMLEMGHPMHAYDLQKIRGRQIHVRSAQAGESLPLLDGQTITLEGFELVIADAERAIGLAGVMGGGNSEVSPETDSLFLECAEFDPALVRRAASVHQRKTDAAYRFERGVDPQGLHYAISRLAHLIVELAGGKVQGVCIEKQSDLSAESQATLTEGKKIRFGMHFVHDFLGFPRDQAPLTLKQMQSFLEDLDCQVSRVDDSWEVLPPSYRLDLSIPEDIAEEVARSVGYDHVPATLPALTSTPVSQVSAVPALTVMARAKNCLVQCGLQETVNLAFTSENWLNLFGLKSSVKLLNPLSAEHAWMVPSLLPGLVRNVLENESRHFGSEPQAIRLFELRPTFSTEGEIVARDQMNTGVKETWKLALVCSGPRYAGGLRVDQVDVDFYDLKAMIERLLGALGTKGARLLPISTPTGQNAGPTPRSADSDVALYHPGKSMELRIGNEVAGYFGLLHPGKARALKVRAPLWCAELDWSVLTRLSRQASEVPRFQSWSDFPPMERDYALVVDLSLSSDRLCQIALKAGKPLAKQAKVFDLYQGNQVQAGKVSVAIRVTFYDEQRSLQESEVESVSSRILEAWKKELGAELRN